jgi:hypothetical protein
MLGVPIPPIQWTLRTVRSAPIHRSLPLAAMAGAAADIKDLGRWAPGSPAARLHDTGAEGSAPWDCGDNDDGRNRHGSLVGRSKSQSNRAHSLDVSKHLETREKEEAREVSSTGSPKSQQHPQARASRDAVGRLGAACPAPTQAGHGSSGAGPRGQGQGMKRAVAGVVSTVWRSAGSALAWPWACFLARELEG